MKAIRCPFCCVYIDRDFFFAHLGIEHDLEEETLENFNKRIMRIGFDPIEVEEKDLNDPKDNLVL